MGFALRRLTSMRTVSRRVAVLALTSALVATPIFSLAQRQAKVSRIGFLSNTARPADGAPPSAWRQALAELGYVDGQNVTYVGRWAESKFELLPQLADELVSLHVDVLVTAGAPASEAAKRATSTIPVIFVAPGDAAATGLVTSLAKPGGNVTGVSDPATELSSKRLGLLKEAVPGLGRVAVIWNANDRAMTLRYGEVEKAASVLRLTIEPFGVRGADEIDGAISTMTQQRPDAILVVSDALTNINRKRILEFAATQHVPAMYEFGFYVQDGGLMSYGPSMDDMFERAAVYIDRVLKGTKPGELPVELPMRYFLFVNLKTAQTLDITVPDSLLQRADEVTK